MGTFWDDIEYVESPDLNIFENGWAYEQISELVSSLDEEHKTPTREALLEFANIVQEHLNSLPRLKNKGSN